MKKAMKLFLFIVLSLIFINTPVVLSESCSCSAYFETLSGSRTGTGTNLFITEDQNIYLKSVTPCYTPYKFTLMESDGFSKINIEQQSDDETDTFIPIANSGVYTSSWIAKMNPEFEPNEGGLGEYYFIVYDLTQELCRSAIYEEDLLFVCKKITVQGLRYNDCDGNDIPDGWCGTSSSMDRDCDRVSDSEDNCLTISNNNQLDIDNDGVGDLCDNCPTIINTLQYNSDLDSFGNACDNCVYATNQYQLDSNNNNIGDLCEKNSPLNGKCSVNGNCIAFLGCGPADTCVDLCVDLGICPDPCEEIICGEGKGCSGGLCIDECTTALQYNLQYDKDQELVNDGDTLSYLFNSKIKKFRPIDRLPVISSEGQRFDFYIDDLQYSAIVGGGIVSTTDNMNLKIPNLDLINNVINFKIGCNLGQPISYIAGGCSSDIQKQCPDGSQALQYSCINNNLQPVLQECALVEIIECQSSQIVDLTAGDPETDTLIFEGYTITLMSITDLMEAQIKVTGSSGSQIENIGQGETKTFRNAGLKSVTIKAYNMITVGFAVMPDATLEINIECDDDQLSLLPLDQKPECSTAGVVCQDLNMCISSVSGGVKYDTQYKEPNCCVPIDLSGFTACFETNVLADGTILNVGRGQCVDEDGNGDGQRIVKVEDSYGNLLNDETQLQAAGYPQSVFNEECKVRPRTIAQAPYYSGFMILLSLLVIIVYYKKNKGIIKI